MDNETKVNQNFCRDLPFHTDQLANVVFPTGIDRRDDLGTPDRFDVYFGMAGNQIGVVRLDICAGWPFF
jgi:hypothetical protein